MNLGTIYQSNISGYKYRTIKYFANQDKVVAENVNDPNDLVSIWGVDVVCGVYIPLEEDQDTCKIWGHDFVEQLNFTFSDWYCSRCGVKR